MIACNATGIGFVASKKEEKDSCRRGTLVEELRVFRGSLTSIMIGLFFRKLIPAIGRIETEQIGRGDTRASKIGEKISEEIRGADSKK